MAGGVLIYCHAHRNAVGTVKKLLAIPSQALIYWDGDFTPGDDWFEHIAALIRDTDQLLVFWCSHAAQSPNVRREYEYGLSIGKRVVPVLLDDSPLVAAFVGLQMVDLREAIGHTRDERKWFSLLWPFSRRAG